MSDNNPFLQLQTRLATLIAASPYFAGVNATTQILTQNVADLENQVATYLLPLGFGVVVTTASGKKKVSSYEALITIEDVNISITHNPTLDTAHSALGALWAIIQAVHGQSVADEAPPADNADDFFAVQGHQPRLDGPAGCAVHELFVTGGLRIL